jgi:protocatechuate 3,4-dioxygenase beta subunit
VSSFGEVAVHEHDLGLAHDLAVFEQVVSRGRTPRVGRRRALGILAGGGAAAVLLSACRVPITGGGYGVTPAEIAGPFPADGANGPNVLTTSGVVRRDIRSSFGGPSGVASGVPLTLRLKITDVSDGNQPKRDAVVYLWQCDQLGRYSLYSSGITDENYLRGVQATDARGDVTFTTIFPGCYPGRWPHMHYEVYPSLAQATSFRSNILTSQIALPEPICDAVYSTRGYEGSAASFSALSLASDLVFRDGWSHEMATVSGSSARGYVASLIAAVP